MGTTVVLKPEEYEAMLNWARVGASEGAQLVDFTAMRNRIDHLNGLQRYTLGFATSRCRSNHVPASLPRRAARPWCSSCSDRRRARMSSRPWARTTTIPAWCSSPLIPTPRSAGMIWSTTRGPEGRGLPGARCREGPARARRRGAQGLDRAAAGCGYETMAEVFAMPGLYAGLRDSSRVA